MGMSPLGATGRRDETSVMFSLSALMAKGTATSEPTTDESGLIDLKAIAAAAGKPAETALTTADIAPFPFEIAPAPQPAEAPAIARAEEAEARAPARRSRALLVGAIIAVAAVAMAFVGTRSMAGEHARAAEIDLGYATRHAASVVASIPAPKAAEAPPSDAPADPGAQKAATTTAQRSTAKQGTQSQGKQGTPPAATNDKTTTSTSNGQTGTKPPSGPCDLMCQMQRAAGR
jgi:hypothetical protein